MEDFDKIDSAVKSMGKTSITAIEEVHAAAMKTIVELQKLLDEERALRKKAESELSTLKIKNINSVIPGIYS